MIEKSPNFVKVCPTRPDLSRDPSSWDPFGHSPDSPDDGKNKNISDSHEIFSDWDWMFAVRSM